MTAPDPSSSTTSPAAATPPLHELERQRRANRDAAASLGLNPYGVCTEGLLPLAEAKSKYDAEADAAHQGAGKTPAPEYVDRRPRVRVAGRIMLLRDNGKLLWLTLRDHSGDLQVAVSQKDCPSPGFEFAKTLDLGDIVIASGPVMKTKTGEVTIWASSLEPASKSLIPPPEKHAGLADVEIRYRRRYVDLWANPETMQVFELRSRLVSRVRRFMEQRGYLEVETPMLQQLAGGAAARPFMTHMNALDIGLFMRIAPELYLKRLLVGGMPRVFEINRNFRNEGLDKQHNPEFTMLEAYHAFGDMNTVMELTESLIRDAATFVHAGGRDHPPAGLTPPNEETSGADETSLVTDVVLPFGDLKINFSQPFTRVTYASLFEKAYGFPMSDGAKARAELKRRHPKIAAQVDQMDEALVINELFEDKQHGGEAQLDPAVPTFITHYPAAISPLVRPNRDNPALADRADLFIAGMEIAPHYTELNDPDIQESKFREQLKGLDADKSAEEATYRTFDQDFIDALKVGMPPAGGMGLGIDRLVMILANQRTIRDVLLFPLMRPV